MRILFMATQLPLPPDAGGKIRTLNILRHLARDHELTVVCSVDEGTPKSVLEAMRLLCKEFIPVPVRRHRRGSWTYLWKLALNAASPYPFSVAKDYSSALRRKTQAIVASGSVDVLVCDYLQAAINVPEFDSVPTVLFQHNVEAEILRRHCELQAGVLGRLFWRFHFWKMRRYERRTCRRFECCIAVSETDRKTFEREYDLSNVTCVDTGVDTAYFATSAVGRIPGRLVFTGSMDWMPNEDAMRFFVEAIFPTIRSSVPEASLSIVGKNPSRQLELLARTVPGVLVTGRVEDIRPHLAEAEVYVVPLRIGGGTRIKIFEAMASGVPVVSTRIGAEGLPVLHGRHILLADSAEEFAAAVTGLLRTPALAQSVTGEARTLVTENYDWRVVAEQFGIACNAVVSRRRGSQHED